MTKPQTKKRTVITTETLEVWVVRSPIIEGSQWPMDSAHETTPLEILPLLPHPKDDDDVLSDET